MPGSAALRESRNRDALLYNRCSKKFLKAGEKRLAGDTAREANSDEAAQLKEALAEIPLENRLLRKSSYGAGGDDT